MKVVINSAAILFTGFLLAATASAQDPMVDAMDAYSSCLIELATGEDPVTVNTIDDLAPLRQFCQPQLDELGKIMPLEYLAPIIEEVELTTVGLIQAAQ